MPTRRIKLTLGNRPGTIGTLTVHQGSGRFETNFRYSEEWLESNKHFALEPGLPLSHEAHFRQPVRGISPFHGIFSDSGPDGWAMFVLARQARHKNLSFDPTQMTPLDYLLSVSDEHRVGALRYVDESGVPATTGNAAPSSTFDIHLSDLLDAAQALERDDETASQIRTLIGEGTSLGGLRPKAAVKDADGKLWIAKFPSVKDTRPVPKGEALALEIARQVGLRVPVSSIMDVAGKPVLLIERFDRTPEGNRKHYASAFTMLQVDRQIDGSYVGIAEGLRQWGDDPRGEMKELFKRMVLSVLINDTDGHLGNHGFLYAGNGNWQMSPVFDINPFPDTKRELRTAISRKAGNESTLNACLSEVRAFDLSSGDATEIIDEMKAVVSRWKTIAMSPSIGMTEREADLFSPAFLDAVTRPCPRLS